MKKSLNANAKRLALLGLIFLMFTSSTSWLNPQVAIADSINVITGKNKIVLTVGSKDITFNDEKTTTTIPITLVKDTTYIAFKTIATLYGFEVSYDAKSKSSVASNKGNKITFTQGSTAAMVNEYTHYGYGGSPYMKDGNLMVPVATWAMVTKSTISVKDNTITLKWDTAPQAYFRVNEQKISAGQTAVTISDLSSSLYGFDIVAEEWIGKQTIYNELGFHTLTRRVKDERGVWSLPYSVQIYVVKPNEAPIAAFTTDKDTYKLGEPVIYTNKSKDDTAIKSNHWVGKELAFFTPGKKTITLTVLDEEGVTSTASKEIYVLDEVLYTKDQFYLNFTDIGNKFPIDSGLALRIAPTSYTITPEDVTIVRTNSPGIVMGPAIDYSDTLSGRVRFNVHKQNGAKQDLELHLMVTNENTETVYIDVNHLAEAGPTSYAKLGGKQATKSYLQSIDNNSPPAQIALLPGKTYELVGAGNSAMHSNQTMSFFAEYTIPEDLPLKFTLMVTEQRTDELAAIKTLQQSVNNPKQVRGTFEHGNRVITTNNVLGAKGTDKLIFGDKGDKAFDQLLQGMDAVTGKPVTNLDNGGVLYKLQLEVAPHTAIVLNPRGGQYGGAFLVNDDIVDIMPRNSFLEGPTEASILYCTGNKQESVSLMFLAPPGSNMPLNLLFLPIPSLTNS